MQVTFASRRLVTGPICNEWSLMYLGMMVLIYAPLSKRAIQLSPFILTLATFLTPCQCWKGSRFKKWVCWGSFMPWESLSGGSLMCWLLSEGSGLPLSLMLSPPCHLTVCFPLRSLQASNCGWNVPGCYNDRSISPPFGHPLQPFLAKCPINSSITPSILQGSLLSLSSLPLASPSSTCAKCTAGVFRMGWLHLSFLRGKKLVSLCFGGLSAVWVLRPLDSSMESSFSASWVALR